MKDSEFVSYGKALSDRQAMQAVPTARSLLGAPWPVWARCTRAIPRASYTSPVVPNCLKRFAMWLSVLVGDGVSACCVKVKAKVTLFVSAVDSDIKRPDPSLLPAKEALWHVAANSCWAFPMHACAHLSGRAVPPCRAGGVDKGDRGQQGWSYYTTCL